MKAGAIVGWFRGLRRGYKFAIVLVAAWAPLVLPRNPVITGVLMQIATVVFFISTGQKSARCGPQDATSFAYTDCELHVRPKDPNAHGSGN